MLNNGEFENVFIACGYTDLRFGIDGLALRLKDEFDINPFLDNTIFLFCGRKADRIKCLVWEGDGFLLLYKRLDKGKFNWPRSIDEVRKLSPIQFERLMSGFSIDPGISKIAAPKSVL